MLKEPPVLGEQRLWSTANRIESSRAFIESLSRSLGSSTYGDWVGWHYE